MRLPPNLPFTAGRPGRYHCNLNILLGKMRAGGGLIKWADVNALKAELEAQVGGLLSLPLNCAAFERRCP